MAITQNIETIKSKLDTIGIKTGQVIYVRDTKSIYFDSQNGTRVLVEDIVKLATDEERTALLAPLNKFYFVKSTAALWNYDAGWIQVSGLKGPSGDILDSNNIFTGTNDFNAQVDMNSTLNTYDRVYMRNRAGSTGAPLCIAAINTAGSSAAAKDIAIDLGLSGSPAKIINVLTPTNDTDAVNKSYVDNLSVFDLVIRTQYEFQTLYTRWDAGTGITEQSVAFVGSFTRSDGKGIKIPQTVKRLQGIKGAKITVANFAYDSISNLGGIFYSTIPISLDYVISNLAIDCQAIVVGSGNGGGYGSSYGFRSCAQLTNCTGTGTGSGYGSGYGFHNCTQLTNCTGTGTGSGNGSGYGFRDCTQLTNCTGTGTGSGNGYGYGHGFRDCTQLTNCTGTGTGSSNGSGYGFHNCTQLTNCTGTIGYSGTTAKIYVTNSPKLILPTRTAANWRNIFVDGVAEFVAINTAHTLASTKEIPFNISPGDIVSIEGYTAQTYYAIAIPTIIFYSATTTGQTIWSNTTSQSNVVIVLSYSTTGLIVNDITKIENNILLPETSCVITKVTLRRYSK